MTEQCSKTMPIKGVWGGRRQCTNRGKVEREGKPYCGQHDPVAREARLQKTLDRYRAEDLERAKRNALHAAAPRMLDLFSELICVLRTDDDLWTSLQPLASACEEVLQQARGERP